MVHPVVRTPRFTGTLCRRLAAAAGMGVLLCFSPARGGDAPSAPEPQTSWTMINVCPGNEQADCHLIEFPDGRKALIDIADAGDAPGTALAYLKSHGVTAVDLVIISHFHRDHYGRLTDLIDTAVAL